MVNRLRCARLRNDGHDAWGAATKPDQDRLANELTERWSNLVLGVNRIGHVLSNRTGREHSVRSPCKLGGLESGVGVLRARTRGRWTPCGDRLTRTEIVSRRPELHLRLEV